MDDERGSPDRPPIVVVERHRELRRVARDWERYTSATPFRVPIPEESDVRPVQQLPIESDPPDHGTYRSIIAPRFSRSAAERIRPSVDRLVGDIVAATAPTGTLHIVDELAIPVVTTAIAATLGRPDDASLLASWGLHVFRDPVTGERRRNAELDRYLAERVDDAGANPGDDLFGDLARADLGGRPLTRDEMLGFGYLVLAGGRDTVIGSIVGAIWYLANHTDERRLLRDDSDRIAGAVEELLRFFSPLAYIGRTVTVDHETDGHRFEQGELIALGFAAANRDPAVFDAPDEVRLDRAPNRHVAFGHGPHTCIGAPLARMQLTAVVTAVAALADIAVLDPTSWNPTVTRGISTVSDLPMDLVVRLAP